jgi:hypothetical protein
MTWAFRSENLGGNRGLRVEVEFDSAPASYARVLRSWRDDQEFRSLFIAYLANTPFSAFRWESPPVTASTSGRVFEFVVLDSPGLASNPSSDAFDKYFDAAAVQAGVVEFPNLGRDAILVVPCPQAAPSAYGHLAAFVREAPESQRHALWALVGDAMQRRVRAAPVWLSTAGAGVPWLHVRLDDLPKYYGFAAYRVAP